MRRIMKTKLKHVIGKFLIAIMVSGMGLASCTYHTNDYDPSEPPDDVSFSEHIIPIFDARCNSVGCHNNGGIPPNLTEDVAYVSLIGGGYVEAGNSEGSVLYQAIDGGTMTGYATDLDRSTIKKWIDDGALNN